jgi:acyl carrier protein
MLQVFFRRCFVTTFNEVAQLLHENFGVESDTLVPATPLTAFGVDSLTLVEVIFAIEEHFGIEIPDRADIKNLADLAKLIDELRSTRKS